jgi:TonB-dependent SusC/RagA subfamily outer membrane receptor
MKRNAMVMGLSLALVVSGCSQNSNPFRDGTRPYSPPGDVRVPYGEQDREDVTGAVTAVPLDENEHFQSVVEMLRSQVPGLQVTELSNGEIRLRIRGDQQTLRTDDESNQPLLVIDGMSILPSAIRSALLGLNPREVESIQVLKDVSSTSIYGSRAANGVILIQLKR